MKEICFLLLKEIDKVFEKNIQHKKKNGILQIREIYMFCFVLNQGTWGINENETVGDVVNYTGTQTWPTQQRTDYWKKKRKCIQRDEEKWEKDIVCLGLEVRGSAPSLVGKYVTKFWEEGSKGLPGPVPVLMENGVGIFLFTLFVRMLHTQYSYSCPIPLLNFLTLDMLEITKAMEIKYKAFRVTKELKLNRN